MVTAETHPAEGSRYAAALLLVPGLWAGPGAWRGFAGFLAHRGWECHLLDVRGEGGLEGRVAAVVGYAAALPSPPVLVGHDAGALAVAAAAPSSRAPAAVLVAPLAPGSPGARSLVRSWRALAALVLGQPVPPPTGTAAAHFMGGLTGPEPAAIVRELVWGRVSIAPATGVPTLLIAGDRDPLLPVATAAALARRLGAEHTTLAGAGHWPLAGPGWQDAVDVLHRWIVQRLGAPLLELYADAMAARETEEE